MVDTGDGIVAGGEEDGVGAAAESVFDKQVDDGGADAAPAVGWKGGNADDLAHVRDGLMGAGGDGSVGGARDGHDGVAAAQALAAVGKLGGGGGGLGGEGFESGWAGARAGGGEADGGDGPDAHEVVVGQVRGDEADRHASEGSGARTGGRVEHHERVRVHGEAGGPNGGTETGGDLVGPLEGLGEAELALALADAGDVLGEEDGSGVGAERGAGVIGPAGADLGEEAERGPLLNARRAARDGIVVRLNAEDIFGGWLGAGHGGDGGRLYGGWRTSGGP